MITAEGAGVTAAAAFQTGESPSMSPLWSSFSCRPKRSWRSRITTCSAIQNCTKCFLIQRQKCQFLSSHSTRFISSNTRDGPLPWGRIPGLCFYNLNTIYLPFILRLADIGNSFNVTSNDPLVMDRCSQCATFNPFTTEAYDWSVRRLAVDSANDSVADGLLSVQTDRHTQTDKKKNTTTTRLAAAATIAARFVLVLRNRLAHQRQKYHRNFLAYNEMNYF